MPPLSASVGLLLTSSQQAHAVRDLNLPLPALIRHDMECVRRPVQDRIEELQAAVNNIVEETAKLSTQNTKAEGELQVGGVQLTLATSSQLSAGGLHVIACEHSSAAWAVRRACPVPGRIK